MDDRAKLVEGILDQAADAVIFADRSGKIARWNRASALLFGFSAEEAVGQNLDLLVPGHLRAAHWRGFDDAMANGLLKLQGHPTLTRAAQERAQALRRDDLRTRRHRRRRTGSGRGGARRHGAESRTTERLRRGMIGLWRSLACLRLTEVKAVERMLAVTKPQY